MRRREFISLLGSVIMAWPSAAAMAQVAAKRPLVAVLVSGSSISAARYVSGFPQGLQVLGYVEGQNIEIVYRYAAGDTARFPEFAKELVRLKPDVIVVSNTPGTFAIRQAITTIPIVNPTLTDPEGLGFITSMARPGGQVTGILLTLDSLPAKLLQLMLEVVPSTSRIGILLNVNNPINVIFRRNTETAVTSFGRQLVRVEVRGPDDLDAAFQTLVRKRVDLALVPLDGLFLTERRRIAALAMSARLPTMYGSREYVEDGGLMSYGVDRRESFRPAAVYVDKILKGAKPGDLPVELPTKLELVINLNTAKALRITIPPPIIVRADEVIESGDANSSLFLVARSHWLAACRLRSAA
jgi:putative ABC transport system substrate-binding protein